MWNAAGELQDAKAVIPDSSYAALYAETIDFCREHGAFDPATMGTTPNVGLMAQKAEEYGSHDKTFEIPTTGTVRVVDAEGSVVLEQVVSAGDIWRMCQTKDVPIRDWVKLAVTRARASATPAVFWLDESRAHDAQLIAKVRGSLSEHGAAGQPRGDDLLGPGQHGTASAQLVRGIVEQDPAAVDDDDVLEQVSDLVDQVGRQHGRAGVLGVVG